MPELPEVETVVRYLKNKIINQTINKINMIYSPVLKNSNLEEFNNYLLNEKFENIGRKGKYIILTLSNNKCLIIHLRMEGKLFAQAIDSKPNFNQLICEFVLNDLVLRFYDTRKFGTFEIVDKSNLNQLKSLAKLAMDANSNDFNYQYLYDISRNSKMAIKTFLLDQSNVAGIGNIYVNEILFECNISPIRKTCEITLEDCKNIVKYSKLILDLSISKNGTTIHTYKFNEYESGGYQNFLKVHDHKGQACIKCHNPINFTKVNGRGTYFCPKCQK